MMKRTVRTNLTVLSSYVLWIISAVIGLGVALVLRGGLMSLYVRLLPSPWTINVVDKAVAIVIILCWIVAVLLCERYYVQGAQEGTLLRRFAMVTVPLLIVAALGYALSLLG